MQVAVAGASGFVGSRLAAALTAAGHDVRALTRHPERYTGAGTPLAADVDDPATLGAALAGCELAYYLVHRLGVPGVVEVEHRSASAFGAAAAGAGVTDLVCLGGLVPPDVATERLSVHLQGRLAVEQGLAASGVRRTAVRAAIVLGRGSAGFELIRQLAVALPVIASPVRSRARVQPIAADDLVGYLGDLLDHPAARGGVLEVGGPDAVSYRELVRRVSRAVGQPGFVPEVLMVPRVVQQAAVQRLTDVDPAVADDLLASLDLDAVVDDPRALDLLPRRPVGLDVAVARAVAEAAA
ncbi:NmrA family NAD(P)-binding protein [Angustibacter aerolatus]